MLRDCAWACVVVPTQQSKVTGVHMHGDHTTSQRSDFRARTQLAMLVAAQMRVRRSRQDRLGFAHCRA